MYRQLVTKGTIVSTFGGWRKNFESVSDRIQEEFKDTHPALYNGTINVLATPTIEWTKTITDIQHIGIPDGELKCCPCYFQIQHDPKVYRGVLIDMGNCEIISEYVPSAKLGRLCTVWED